MPETNFKIKIYLKRAALFGSLFLAIFAGLFYIVNLDLNPNENVIKNTGNIVPDANDSTNSKNVNNSTASSIDINAEMKNRLGSTTFSLGTYDEWTTRYGLNNTNNSLDADPDKDGLPNYLEYVYGTDPIKTDTDGDGYSDKQEINNGYDPDAPGDTKPTVQVSISKINIEAPMVWSQSDNDDAMLKDLEGGVSHFPKSVSPGQIGNMIISGHSSNYIWAKGDYNHVFKDLNNLENGDVIVIKATQQNGRIITYHYQVTDKFIAAPDDERIFAPSTDPTLTLSTCWPIGTNLRRLIVKTELVK